MSEKFWVPHPDLIWAPCERKADGQFEDAEGKLIKFAGSPDKVHLPQLAGVDDICSLDSISKAVLLHSVRVRYDTDVIYTYVSRILISVNPFRSLSIYGPDVLSKYLLSEDVPAEPHIFGTGYDALKGLRQAGGRSQAVLVSGESGAGKTEAVKLVLSYVTAATSKDQSGPASVRYDVSCQDLAPPPLPEQTLLKKKSSVSRYTLNLKEPDIQEQIMQTNPILEAFGNAMTVRNNNSSRFGKWMEIPFSRSQDIEGCKITDYLLELTRVCSCAAKERTYHVFFALIEKRHEAELASLDIAEPDEYEYLKGRQFKVPTVDDEHNYVELVEAFESLGFDDDVRRDIFKIVIGVLSLGNIVFKTDEADDQGGACIANEDWLRRASVLLNVDLPVLQRLMLTKTRKVAGERVESTLKEKDATSGRDAFARLIYGQLFKWLVARINKKLLKTDSIDQFLGLLDIAGFESFETNSLEQLLINLSNEHLQGHFNAHFITQELATYKAEGVDVPSDFQHNDNSDIIELVAGKNSILTKLDDSCSMVNSTDDSFLTSVEKELKGTNKRLIVHSIKKPPKFTIEHFAGKVEYMLDGFIEKNVDKPPDESATCLNTSSNSILKEMADALEAQQSEQGSGGPRGGTKRKAKTVSSSFKTSLASLMTKLKEAQPHFVRCVKPNAQKVRCKFESQSVMEQLTYSGVLEAVRIRQIGYASRMPFEQFVEHYSCVVDKDRLSEIEGEGAIPDPKKRCAALLELFPEEVRHTGKDELVLGTTKVFMKTAYTQRLDAIRQRIREELLRRMQALRDALKQACLNPSVAALEAAVANAKAGGLDEDDCADAIICLERERKREECRQKLAQACETNDIGTIKKAIKDAEEVYFFSEEDLALARKVLQDGICEWVRGELAEACQSRSMEALREALKDASENKLSEDDPALTSAKKALEEEERKERAKAAVDEATASGVISTLEETLRVAESAGVPEAQLEAARARLEAEKRKVAAREQLAAVASGDDVAAIKAAIQEGSGAGLAESELQEARRALQVAEQKEIALVAVVAATRRRDMEELRAAIAEGEARGVSEAELAAAKQVLAEEERRASAQLKLKGAVQGNDLARLEAAISEAVEAGVAEKMVQAARQVLTEMKRMVAAREGLQKAAASRSIDLLEAALREGQAAGLQPSEMKAAQAVLDEKRRHQVERQEARKAASALQGTMESRHEATARLQTALGQLTRQASLPQEELQELQGILSAEEAKDQTRCEIAAALDAADTDALHTAIVEAGCTGLSRAEIAAAQAALARLERMQAARAVLEAAIRERKVHMIRAAIEDGRAAEVPEEQLAEAERVAQYEELKAEVQRALSRATRGRQIPELQEAIHFAEEHQMMELAELKGASKVLEEEECKVTARQRLAHAEASAGTVGSWDLLRDAIAAGESVGLEPEELATARELAVREEEKALARQRLKEASKSMRIRPCPATTGALLSALSACRESGVPAAEWEEEREELLAQVDASAEDAQKDFLALRDRLVPPARQLALEVALRLGRLHGLGGLAWKVTAAEPPAAVDAQAGARFARMMESLWSSKDCNLLGELCTNLRTCQLKDGLPGGPEPLQSSAVGYKQIFSTCHGLREAATTESKGAEGTLADMALHPLALLCAVLYTQQDVDVDRLMLFPDVPAQPVAQANGDNADAYEAYRGICSKSGGTRRNTMLFEEVTWSATACCRALESNGVSFAADPVAIAEQLDPGAKQHLESWIKWVCLLSSLAARPLNEEKTVSRVLASAPQDLLEDLSRRRPGSEIFWPAPLSTTQDPRISDRYANGTRSSVSQNVIFVINGVRQGLELGRLSQYPDEDELLLPACSRLRVASVRSGPQAPLVVECEYLGTMLSQHLLEACWSDLREASYDLTSRATKDLATAKVPRISFGSPSSPSPPPHRESSVPWMPTRPPLGAHRRTLITATHTTSPHRSHSPTRRSQQERSDFQPPGRGRLGQTSLYSDRGVKSLFALFEAMDRRGIYALSREDFLWAQKTLAASSDFQRVLRNSSIVSHFFNTREDLSLCRFFVLSLPRATEAELERALRFAAGRLQRRRLSSRPTQQHLASGGFGRGELW